jgi:hypothetical protein
MVVLTGGVVGYALRGAIIVVNLIYVYSLPYKRCGGADQYRDRGGIISVRTAGMLSIDFILLIACHSSSFHSMN